MTEITRHFMTVGTRQVHYRRAGSGPPVVLLHPSPNSGAAAGLVPGAQSEALPDDAKGAAALIAEFLDA